MLPQTFPELMVPAALTLLAISLLLERWQGWQDATAETKQLATGLLMAVFTVVVTLYEVFVPESAQVQIGEVYILIRPLLEHLLQSFGLVVLAFEGGHRVLNKWVPSLVTAPPAPAAVLDFPTPPAPPPARVHPDIANLYADIQSREGTDEKRAA